MYPYYKTLFNYINLKLYIYNKFIYFKIKFLIKFNPIYCK